MIDVQLSSEDNLDLLFVIRSPEGYPVFFDDDSGAGFLPEVIDLLIEHDGDHMLVIQPLGTNQRGSFTVTLTARVPEVASMDELLSAEFGDKYRRRAYEFEVESLGTYRITATPDTGNVSNLVISAIQDGSVINSSSGIPTDESLTFDIEIHPGTLRIVVADYSLIQRQVSVIIEPVADIDEG
jgi:hypothetical protein